MTMKIQPTEEQTKRFREYQKKYYLERREELREKHKLTQRAYMQRKKEESFKKLFNKV